MNFSDSPSHWENICWLTAAPVAMNTNIENINSIVQKRSNLPLLLVNNYHWVSFASNLKKKNEISESLIKDCNDCLKVLREENGSVFQ